MLIIKANTLRDAWEKSLVGLYEKGMRLKDPEIFKDDALFLEIKEPLNGDCAHPLFPMADAIMKEYKKFIISGKDKGNVLSEHALYHDRLFSYPPDSNNQIRAIINKLKENPYSKRAQASLWYPDEDQTAKKVPCLQILWCRIENRRLVMHTHMRANDAYRKLLMNLNIFASVMEYISNELSVEVGRYIHFVDSFHIYKKDISEISKAVEAIEVCRK